jgi:hypothetical protein
MTEARALLEAALAECNLMPSVSIDSEGWPEITDDDDRTMLLVSTRMLALTPSGDELLRRADRPEARVAEGLTVERCAGYDLSDRPDLAPNIVCTLPAGHTGYHLPAPRPPEPDRTAALVEAARMLEYLWSAENLNGAVVSDYFYDDDPLTEDVPRVIAAARAALAATPDEAP